MKIDATYSKLVCLAIFLILSFTISAQSGVGANFGIEAGVYSGDVTSGAGTDDWFYNNISGAGVIDEATAIANGYATQLATGNNITFNLRQSIPNYSTNAGYVWYSSRYGRDHVSSISNDLTIFSSGKNGENPLIDWGITAGSVPSKTDIVDAGVHMRRDGVLVSNDLWVDLNVSTLSTSGNHFVDFELFVSEIVTSGAGFTNSGTNEGHTAWTFNPDGSVASIGDMVIGFSFSGSGVTGLEVRLWVDRSLFTPGGSPGPASGFTWGASIDGSTTVNGYAQITVPTAALLSRVNTVVTGAPPWGTETSTGYSLNYNAGALAEVGINFTTLGFDPSSIFGSTAACDSPFSALLVKSRTSSSFTSALKDFMGPIDFLGSAAGTGVNTAIIDPGDFDSCLTGETLNLQANFISNYAEYTWTSLTPGVVFPINGTNTYTATGVTGQSVDIDTMGEYQLGIAPLLGCTIITNPTEVITINATPCAVDDSYNTEQNITLNVAPTGIIANDTDREIGDVLTVNTTPVVDVTYGTLTLMADGSFTYVPNTGFLGTDSFTYQVCDNNTPALCDSAVVTIKVDTDYDGDGVLDYIDIDDDNDGIPDSYESGGIDPSADADSDGIPNYQDADFCTLNTFMICDNLDFDGDGIPNHFDLDADNDAIPDVIEAGYTDANNDGLVDTTLLYGTNGLADELETAPDSGVLLSDPINTDAAYDSNPGITLYDFLDVDSDNDGITDTTEAFSNNATYTDTDNGGQIDGFVDADNNGWHDTIDAEVTLPTFVNSDADAIPNYLDLDSDGDGLPDTFEGNFQVSDGDNNGIVGTGIPFDTDGDGLADTNDPDAAGNILGGFGFNQDRDGDGVNNTMDIDIDNDGIIDNIEGQPTIGYDPPSGNDTDGDGLDDAYDVDNGGDAVGYTNTDGGSAPDYADTDADDPNGAGADPFDIQENFYTGPGEDDFDNDGILDLAAFTDTDGDGLADIFDLQLNISAADNATNAGQTPLSQPDTNGIDDRDWRDLDNSDNDGDGIADIIDLDDDNDGILDSVEGVGDLDEDGVPNKDDLDSDNDGISDYTEAGGTSDTDNSGMPGTGVLDGTEVDANGVPTAVGIFGLTPMDTDGDGDLDFLDIDSDNDGISDVIEAGGIDNDGDGHYGSGITNDSDADGMIDALDVYDNRDGNLDTLLGGTPLITPNTDGDSQMDYLDLDSDNDTIPDNVEAQSTVGYIAPTGLDTNNDGLDDAYDFHNGGTPVVPVNTDGLGNADYLDLDSDEDGSFDIVEAGNGVADTDADGITNGTTGANGLDNAYDDGTAGDTFIDPNGALDNTQTDNFPDADLDVLLGGDVDYRDIIFNDNDSDGIPDITDLDDDNDGITDLVESGGIDPNADADTDGIPNYQDADFCTLNTFLICDNLDPDGDGISNHFDIDSDGDGCYDVIEAGFTDSDLDGVLGASPVTVDANGQVTGQGGYTSPLDGDSNSIFDFQEGGSANTIDTNPSNQIVIEGSNTSFSVIVSGSNITYQWQVSTDGGTTFTNLSDVDVYTGVTTANLNITGALIGMNGYLYQVIVGNSSFICSPIISTTAILDILNNDNDNDGVIDSVDLDDDNDGILDTNEIPCSTTEFSWANLGLGSAIVATNDLAEMTITHNSSLNFVSSDVTVFNGNYGFTDYAELRFDTDNSSPDDKLIFTLDFSKPITGLNFSIGDVDNFGSSDALEIYYNGNNIVGSGYVTSIGSAVALDNESYMEGYEGVGNSTVSQTNGQIDLDFGSEPIRSIRIEYFSSSALGSDPNSQEIGISNLSFDCIGIDTDNDNILDQFDLNSDGDGCSDTIEAGFTDPDGDGILGTSPVAVDANGQVTGQGGYTTPADLDTNSISDFQEVGPDINNNGTPDGCEADLILTKTVDKSSVNIGDTITFTITIINEGPAQASSIQVKDELAAGLINAVATPSTGTYSPAIGIWDLDTTLNTGESATLQIQVVIGPTCTKIINRAEIISSSAIDSDSTPNNGR